MFFLIKKIKSKYGNQLKGKSAAARVAVVSRAASKASGVCPIKLFGRGAKTTKNK